MAGESGLSGFEPPFDEEPASSVRKVIAARMLESKLTIPHFYLFDEIDMKSAAALRESLNAAHPPAGRISVNDLIVKAAAAALSLHPDCNVSYADGTIRRYREININIAVATERGLLVPTIRDCDKKSLREISVEAKTLVEKARSRKLRPREMMGGTFTVSNLGALGLQGSFSIINPPQSLILTTGAVREVPVVEGGALAVGLRMKATLSCDHRAVDGAGGALFLADFKRMMEDAGEFLV